MHRVFVTRKRDGEGYSGVVAVVEDRGGAEVYRFQGLSYGEVVELVARVAPEGAATTDRVLVQAAAKLGKRLTYLDRDTPYRGVFRNGNPHPVRFRGEVVPPGGEVAYEALVHDSETQRGKALATRAFRALEGRAG
ncbi:hypothetical protein HRbin39_00116 [bacterium HR39]|nr:hypothetical protein HRbin39_00116 [bacterium HR39]